MLLLTSVPTPRMGTISSLFVATFTAGLVIGRIGIAIAVGNLGLSLWLMTLLAFTLLEEKWDV